MITGVSGFLGSHLLKFLLATTNYKFVAIKRETSNLFRLLDIDSTRVEFFDVSNDFNDLEDAFKDKNILSIIHCATNYGKKGESCVDILHTNLIFPIKLLELAIKYNVESFINTDSYFNKPQMSYQYLQNYSLSKKSLLLWLKLYSEKIKIANVVLEHIYGPQDNLSKFVPFLINEIAKKNSSSVDLTGGEQKRDFIYIDDVVKAYKYILDFTLNKYLKFKQFNIGTGKAYSIKELACEIKKQSKSSTKLNFGALPYRVDEIMISQADNSEMKNIGWEAEYDLRKGIGEYIKYVQK